MKKRYRVIVALSLVIIVVFLYFKDRMQKNRLKTEGTIVNGMVDSMSYAVKTGCFVQYHFSVNGVKYEGESKIYVQYAKSQILIGKSFPVLCLKQDPSRNAILITPQNFDYYDLTFPDSLKWVIEYQKLF
jgi:hypothetical protein